MSRVENSLVFKNPTVRANTLKIISAVIICLFTFTGNATAGDPTDVIGFTEPFTTIDLAASETGTLQSLNVQRGDSVKKGQVLASLDTEVLEANLAIAESKADAESRLQAAQIRRDRAQQNYEKLTQALDEGFGGRRELEIAESELKLAETDVKAVQDEQRISRLEVARIQAELKRRQLVSPITGVVTNVHRDVGEFVASLEPEVVTVVDLSQLRIRFHPASADAVTLTKGSQVSVMLVHSGQRLRATVEFVSPVIDPDSDTIQVDVLLDNRKGHYRSGRRCRFLGLATSVQPSMMPLAKHPRRGVIR